MTRALSDKSRTIRIPVHMNESLNKFVRAMRELEKELGRTPTNEEIGRRLDTPMHKIEELKSISRHPVSLDLPVGRDRESVWGDLIENRLVGSLTDTVFENDVREELRRQIVSNDTALRHSSGFIQLAVRSSCSSV